MYVPWYGHMYQVLEVLISKFLKYQHVVRPVFHVVKLGPKAQGSRDRPPRRGRAYMYFRNLVFKMILLHGRILRGFPFGNDIMPARSAAVDLYRNSLPPRHRAAAARWRGGKEFL